VLSCRGPGRDVGALGDIEAVRDCPEKTPMVAQISQGRAWGLSKIEHLGKSKMTRYDAHLPVFPVTGEARLKKLLLPCCRRMRRIAGYFAGNLEALPRVANDA
jgi:hypothetical protein